MEIRHYSKWPDSGFRKAKTRIQVDVWPGGGKRACGFFLIVLQKCLEYIAFLNILASHTVTRRSQSWFLP